MVGNCCEWVGMVGMVGERMVRMGDGLKWWGIEADGGEWLGMVSNGWDW